VSHQICTLSRPIGAELSAIQKLKLGSGSEIVCQSVTMGRPIPDFFRFGRHPAPIVAR
jgi:hypothetical protein